MANTIAQRTLLGSASSRKIVRHIHIISDGTQESNTIVYDNSAFINDVSRGKVNKIWFSGSSCTCRLSWDQTTDSPIISFNPQSSEELEFHCFGGISNPNGTGAVGDILLTTVGLTAGAEVTIVLEIIQE